MYINLFSQWISYPQIKECKLAGKKRVPRDTENNNNLDLKIMNVKKVRGNVLGQEHHVNKQK